VIVLWLTACLGPFPSPSDVDADGFTPAMGDCDDDAADVFPGAEEIPLDGVDQDCDTLDACADLDCDRAGDVVFSLYAESDDVAIESLLMLGLGGDAERSEGLPTLAAEGATVADLDLDGDLDLVFANGHDDGGDPAVDSYAYFNDGAGPSAGNRVALPTLGALDSAAGDFDGDGFVDLAFANSTDGVTLAVDSVVYWGSASGFSADSATALPTVGAAHVSAEDLDFDGFSELIFASTDGESVIYWGSADGYSTDDRSWLPTTGATGSAVGDVNGDGYPDLVFCHTWEGEEYAVESRVWYGSADGYVETNAVTVPTSGATEAAVADIDGDGHGDVVFANSHDGDSEFVNSIVYWGSAEGLGERTTALPTVGAAGVAVGDVDGDGFTDVAFANRLGDSSVVYWGSESGLSTSDKTEIPTTNASDVAIAAP
jgi:hypothetical protein